MDRTGGGGQDVQVAETLLLLLPVLGHCVEAVGSAAASSRLPSLDAREGRSESVSCREGWMRVVDVWGVEDGRCCAGGRGRSKKVKKPVLWERVRKCGRGGVGKGGHKSAFKMPAAKGNAPLSTPTHPPTHPHARMETGKHAQYDGRTEDSAHRFSGRPHKGGSSR